MNKKKLLKIIFFGLVTISSLILVSGREYNYFNPTMDWYTVEPWELRFCQTWGGTLEAQQGAKSSEAISLSQTTLSLNGKKQIYAVDGFDKTLYTITWYLEPTINIGSLGYEIFLINQETDISLSIKDGEVSYESPAIEYHAAYYDHDYNEVKMVYGSEWIIVPIIAIE